MKNCPLIKKIKPEVLDALKESEIKYSSSYRSIIESLSCVGSYNRLTINEVHTLITFLPREFKPKGDVDLFYGDFILQKKYQL